MLVSGLFGRSTPPLRLTDLKTQKEGEADRMNSRPHEGKQERDKDY